MPDEQPSLDNTPIFSKRQLIQAAGQFVTIFATGLIANLTVPGGSQVTTNMLIVLVSQAFVATMGVLGFSYIPPHK